MVPETMGALLEGAGHAVVRVEQTVAMEEQAGGWAVGRVGRLGWAAVAMLAAAERMAGRADLLEEAARDAVQQQHRAHPFALGGGGKAEAAASELTVAVH